MADTSATSSSTSTPDQRTPEEIERDIRETQAEMSRTARKIGDELTPRNILDAMLDKAGQKGVDTDFLIETARRNPLALGMITIGGLWLVSDAEARPSAMKLPKMGGGNRSSGESDGFGSPSAGYEGWHPEHRSYVEHMSRCERMADEDDQTYRRRRDHARASYFMLEQGHDEDEGAFRKRLDEATERLRQRREQMSERTSAFASQSRDRAQALADQTRERSRKAMEDARGFYADSPLLSGLAAAFVGAVAGSALPATRTEENYAGRLGEQAIDAAGSKARQAGEQVRQRKDQMLDQAEQRFGSGPQGQQSNDGSQDYESAEGGGQQSPRFGEGS